MRSRWCPLDIVSRRTECEQKINESVMKAYDVRAVANIVLGEAQSMGVPLTNLHLNKALYFLHADFLQEFGKPLVGAKIEAWQHGPVFREIYNQFKANKRNPIREMARKVDFESGELVEAKEEFDDFDLEWIKSFAKFYVGVPAAVLYDMAHASGGAWDHVYNGSDQINVGMEITSELILQHENPREKRIIRQ